MTPPYYSCFRVGSKTVRLWQFTWWSWGPIELLDLLMSTGHANKLSNSTGRLTVMMNEVTNLVVLQPTLKQLYSIYNSIILRNHFNSTCHSTMVIEVAIATSASRTDQCYALLQWLPLVTSASMVTTSIVTDLSLSMFTMYPMLTVLQSKHQWDQCVCSCEVWH